MPDRRSNCADWLILHEDDDLLVVNKPPLINTHAVDPDGSAGIYDWLRNRLPRWAHLSTHQRLDKETSGVLLFGKSRAANPSLAEQFAGRDVEKSYLLRTDRDPGTLPRTITSGIYKAGGNDFRTTDDPAIGQSAETRFRLVERNGDHWLIEALPLTGRTHQIRLHARDAGFPILGDEKYGGSPFPRLCLHARALTIRHPVTNAPMQFEAPVDFETDPHILLRQRLWPDVVSPDHAADPDFPPTNAWRLIHGASDGHPGWYVDRLGDWLLSQSESAPSTDQLHALEKWMLQLRAKGVYHKNLDRHVRKSQPDVASPDPVLSGIAPDQFEIIENGVRFQMSFVEGYSVGLFLDQKDNRHRLLTGHLHGPKAKAARSTEIATGVPYPLDGLAVLNTFAYTCGFSVCAALAGARVTSLDLSRKYLDWGRANFRLNQLDPAQHDFIYGDCFDWMKRLAKKGRKFDMVLLDPPTFSQSKASGTFRADKDYGKLVARALELLSPGGVLFSSTNCATLRPSEFLDTIRTAVGQAGRSVDSEFLSPQPPDFPTGAGEHGYLKTVWHRIS